MTKYKQIKVKLSETFELFHKFTSDGSNAAYRT